MTRTLLLLAALPVAATLSLAPAADGAAAPGVAPAVPAGDCRASLPEKEVERIVGHDVRVSYATYASVSASVCEFRPTRKGVTPFDYDGNTTAAYCFDSSDWKSYVASVRHNPTYQDVTAIKVRGAAQALTWSVDQDVDEHHYPPVHFVAARGADGSLVDVHLWGLTAKRTTALGARLLARVQAAGARQQVRC
jgi:hypothetical protein